MKRIRLIALVLIIVMAGAAGLIGLGKSGLVSAADDPNKTYALKPAAFKSGDKEKLIFKFEAIADAKVPTMPTHPAMPMYSKMEREIEQKITELDGEDITKIERTYKSSKVFLSRTSTQGKQDMLEGKTAIIDQTGDVNFKNLPKDIKKIDADALEEVKKSITMSENNFRMILPRSDVKIKEQWEVDSGNVIGIFNFANPRKRPVHHGCTEVGINSKFTSGNLTCTLKEIKKVKPATDDCAVIELAGSLKGNDGGLNIDIAITGTAVFNLKKAKFLKVECDGTIKMTGDQPCTKTAAVGGTEVSGKLKFAVEFK